MVAPVRFPQLERDHTIDVASSHEFSHAFSVRSSNNKYTIVTADPRYPSKVEQLGAEFWKDALPQSPLSRAVALSVRSDRLAVATVGGRLLAGSRNSTNPCSCELSGIPRGCMEYMDEGLLVAAKAGATNELVLMSVDERNGGSIKTVASEPLMHAPTSLSSSTNRVAVSDASNNAIVYKLEESRNESGELGYSLVLTHMIPECSAVLSVHGDVLLTRENDECANINVMAMGDQHAVHMASLSGCCHAEASQDRIVSIENHNGAPALVVYRVEEGTSGIVRHAPRELSFPASDAVSFSVNNAGQRNVITSRASFQLWVM